MKKICIERKGTKAVSLKLVQVAIAAIEAKKGIDIKTLDLRGQSDICDYQIVCSAENERQTKAISDNIEELCKKELKVRAISIEGKASGHWVAMDFGSVVIHIFHTKLRSHYAIESLWPKSEIDVKESMTSS